MTASPQKEPDRHCMVVHAYYPIGETRVERQALALRARGIEVDVICLRKPGEAAREVVDGIQVFRMPVQRTKYRGGGMVAQFFEYLAFLFLALVHLSRLHLAQRYAVVQVHNLPDFLVFAAAVPKLTGARIILDLHDLMPEFYAERRGQPMDSTLVRVVRWQERLSCRFADHVITVTELWRQALMERGVPGAKITVVMNVADDRVFHQDMARDVSDRDGSFRLIYHGTLARRYGLDIALRALNVVRESVPDVRLTIHGNGPHRAELEELTGELGLQDCVEFSTRFVPTDELPALLKKADLGIVPYREGVFTGGILPTKLMEYAALGIPAIAARTPAIAAHFDETAVQFFDPGDVEGLVQCILALYHDRGRLAELARGITGFNERYNWPEQSARYLQLRTG